MNSRPEFMWDGYGSLAKIGLINLHSSIVM